MKTSVKQIECMIPSFLPVGEYRGVWGGYIVRVKHDGKKYRMKTSVGIRTPKAPCIVTVGLDGTSVETLRDYEARKAEEREPMDIHSPRGTKVVYVRPNAGYDAERERAQRYLTLGQTYTVEFTKVHSSSTDVYLQEFPGVFFNSVHFDEAEITP